VEGLLVVNRNGVVLQTEDVDDSEETLGTLTTFLGSSCESTAEVMGADRFTTALIVERSQRKLLVVNTRNFFIGVIGSAHIQVDPLTRGVLSCVRKAAVSGRTRQNKPVHDSSMDNSRESNSSDMLCPAQTSETGVAVSEDKEAKE